jgi:hypothetical protein
LSLIVGVSTLLSSEAARHLKPGSKAKPQEYRFPHGQRTEGAFQLCANLG